MTTATIIGALPRLRRSTPERTTNRPALAQSRIAPVLWSAAMRMMTGTTSPATTALDPATAPATDGVATDAA